MVRAAPGHADPAVANALCQLAGEVEAWKPSGMFGPALVEALVEVFRGLPEAEKRDVVLIGSNYGEAGAIDFYGPRYGLPGAVAPVGSYWHFGPGKRVGRVVISIGLQTEDLVAYFGEVLPVATVGHPYAVAEERTITIHVARKPRTTLQEIWTSFEGAH